MESKKGLESFRGLKSHELTKIQVSDTIIGHGSYAGVLEVEYIGLKCAGKKIHDMLLQQGSKQYIPDSLFGRRVFPTKSNTTPKYCSVFGSMHAKGFTSTHPSYGVCPIKSDLLH